MREKSLGKNAILNMFKTLISLLFPLITFPYLSRILDVEGLGKVNFSNSVVNYFSLIAILGVKTYAVREGSPLREDKDKFQKFYSQIFSLTMLTTCISYGLLVISLIFSKQLHEYWGLILILSTSILFTTLGSEWVCSVHEDYGYITVRSIVFQIISLLLLFIFVKEPSDYYKYAVILVISSSGANIANFFYIRKYCDIKFTYKIDFSRHIKPLLILFASTLATTIYVSSDITMLGLICGDYYTGLYSVSTKIYSIIKNLLASILIVSIPRFSFYFNTKKIKEYNLLLCQIGKTLTMLTLPTVVGIFLLSDDIILLISGENYSQAASSLRILSLAVIFVVVSWLLSQCVLIPMKYERYVLKTTLFTAGLNVVLNLILVPRWNQNATAFTTLISEALVAMAYYLKVKDKIHISGLRTDIFQAILGCSVILCYMYLIKYFMIASITRLIVAVIGSILIYTFMLFIMKNDILECYINLLLKKFRKNN